MKHLYSSKTHSSLYFDELINLPEQRQQNWLLTYLDVFVLIIMLVVTLIAVGGFNIEPPTLEPLIKKSPQKKAAVKKPIEILPEPKGLSKDTPEVQHDADAKELVKEQPVKEISVKEDLTGEEVTNDALVKEELVIDEKLKEESVEEQPVLEEPIKEEMVKEELIKQELLMGESSTTAPPPLPLSVEKNTDEDESGETLKNTDQDESVETIEEVVEYETKPEPLDNRQSELLSPERLKQSVDDMGLTDSVEIKVTTGYAQLEIQDKILFQSSEAMLVGAGQALLKQLAPLLQRSAGIIYIEGHTDNRPINTAEFPSNWELGALRATSVLRYLASSGLDVARLRAVSYADTKPVADNNTVEGREKNRRVSIIIKISDQIE